MVVNNNSIPVCGLVTPVPVKNSVCSFLAYVFCCYQAFSPIGASRRSSTSIDVVTRDDFLQAVGVIAASIVFAPVAWADETLPSGVTYTIIKKGDGPQPMVGELAAIRFNAFNGETKIDDIFDTPEPLYTRVGSGGMLKGVEEVLPLMRLGDRWKLTIPGNMAFGSKGRPSSAGKPRIQPDATIVFEVEMVGLPGREPELIELIGD